MLSTRKIFLCEVKYPCSQHLSWWLNAQEWGCVSDGLWISTGHPLAKADENDSFCPACCYQAALENEHCWVKIKQQMTFCFLHKLVYRLFVFQMWFSRRCANIAAILAVALLFKPEHRFVGVGMSIYISELFPCKIPWIPNIWVCVFWISLF